MLSSFRHPHLEVRLCAVLQEVRPVLGENVQRLQEAGRGRRGEDRQQEAGAAGGGGGAAAGKEHPGQAH